MLLAEVADASRRVAATRARSQKVAELAALLLRTPVHEVALATAYAAGELPQSKLGVGYATLRALRGTPAAAESGLQLADVDRELAAVAAEAGAGSGPRRTQRLAALLSRATADEQDFLVRLMAGELRQGALAGVVVEAVARAFAAPAEAVRRAVMLAGSLPVVAGALARDGVAALATFDLRLFQPVQPMLADTAADPDDALARLADAGFEYKLDGARVQVHKDGDRVELYSRALNRVTDAVPELVERVRALPARRLVLDGEAMAFGPDARPLPFQVTMRRFGRRLEVARLRDELPLAVTFFDALRIDDDTLIDRPLHERWAALRDATGGELLVPRLVGSAAVPLGSEDVDAFYARALAHGYEGIMGKSQASLYAAGRRGQEWLKLKPAHTLDLVVLAAEWGSGRRQGWLSNLHLGARDPGGAGFVMLGKTFKGMTDELLTWQTEALLARAVARDGAIVHVRPELVVEIAFNDVQWSSQYPGGVALRFARVKRYRPDKTAAEANTLTDVLRWAPART